MLFKPGDIVCDRFAIERLVGAGGMSEVYRGRDSRLSGRVVAVKALRRGPTQSSDARKRILTEVRSLAKLNHSHIATLYDVCTHDNFDVIVMEFLEGTTVEDLLRNGPLPEADVLRYGVQLANALAYAHRNGVVHRDIKPANIIVTNQAVKLLDFGIAKLTRSEHVSSTADTETNVLDTPIMGTLQYMSPEQRAGREVDHRTDLYSLGLVLSEMLTGSPAGLEKISQVSGRSLRVILEKCLAPDPEQRWSKGEDLSVAFSLALEPVTVSPAAPPKAKTNRRAAGAVAPAAAFALIAIATAAWIFLPRTATPAAEYSFLVSPPPGTHFISLETAGPPEISPDGSTLAFVAAQTDGQTSLWTRALNSVTPTSLRGTEGASHPFWSPDSKALGFFSGGKLKRIDLPDSAPLVLCDALNGRGGTWSKDGVIVFTPSFTEALYRVSATGGKPRQITDPRFREGETSHRWPAFLPDGKNFIFFVRSDLPEVQGLYISSLDTVNEYKRIADIGSGAVYTGGEAGSLVYKDGEFLVARSFSPSSGRVGAMTQRIVPLPLPHEDTSVAPASVSTNGMLVYGGGSVDRQALRWVDMQGRELSVIHTYGQHRNPRLSPDRGRVAVERLEFRTGFASIWLFDLERNLQNPFEQVSRAAFSPVWSPDGKSLVYAAYDGRWNLTMRGAIDNSAVSVLREGGVQVATEWSRNREWVIFQEKGETDVQDTTAQPWDLGAFNTVSGKVLKLTSSQRSERQAMLSPDNAWLVYTSDEYSTDQVFIARFPTMTPRIPVSGIRSSQPKWSADGSQIFYLTATDESLDMMRVKVDLELDPPRLGKPEKLFPVDMLRGEGFTAPVNYDVDSERGRFLIAGPPRTHNIHQELTVKVNWRTHDASR